MWSNLAVLLLLFVEIGQCLTPVKPLTEWEVGSANHFGAPKVTNTCAPGASVHRVKS